MNHENVILAPVTYVWLPKFIYVTTAGISTELFINAINVNCVNISYLCIFLCNALLLLLVIIKIAAINVGI